MIKLLTILGDTVVIGDIEDNGDKYTVKNPLIPAPMQDPRTGKPTIVLIPPNPIKPLSTWEVPKDHIYSIDSLQLELIELYNEMVKKYELAQSGLEIPDDKPPSNPNLKILN